MYYYASFIVTHKFGVSQKIYKAIKVTMKWKQINLTEKQKDHDTKE